MKNDKGEKGLNTIIGKGTHLEGQIEVNGGIRIDGQVKGKIVCTDTLSVGGEGIVEADLKSKHAIIEGKVNGNIIATEKLELHSTSVLIGEFTTKRLAVEEGAVFHGMCNMKEEKKQPEKKE
jgi:cytoskeletal protein CcmA (bactofilin family)